MLNRKTMILLILLVSLPALVLAEPTEEKKDKIPVVPWQSYHAAMATGKAESKPILLHFTIGKSGPSENMRLNTYAKMNVARYLQENFATGWIDVEVHPALGKKYDIETSLTLWFLDPRGQSLTSVDGYLGPEKLMLVLEYINTKSYQKMSYEDWKEKRPRR
jgi:thioredoxin-related protein